MDLECCVVARMTIGKGVDEYIASLERLKFRTPDVAGRAIFEGARVVADKIRENIEALPVQDAENKKHKHRNPTQGEKDGMLKGLGVAKKRSENGNVNVKIGMDGYNDVKTKKHPKGQPNAMIARSIESGSSFKIRHPFISSAVRTSKAAAEEAMRAEVDKQVKEIMGDG